MLKKIFALQIPYQNPLDLYAWYCSVDHTACDQSVILHSARHKPEGRYSFIALSPFRVIRVEGGVILDSQHVAPISNVNPWDYLAQASAAYAQETDPDLPPFQGGLCGYFGYEMLHHLEEIARPQIPSGVPDLWIGFYDTIISFDHEQQKAWVVAQDIVGDGNSVARAKVLADRLAKFPGVATAEQAAFVKMPELHSAISPGDYEKKVEKILDYIRAGDVYQVNFSRVLEGVWSASQQQLCDSSFALYRQLCQQNPAPFSAYMTMDNTAIVSASPERFLKIESGVAQTKPIKGTCPRSSDPVEDARLQVQLQACPKNHAENLMIVDLLRNDLSKFCSHVEVPALMAVESYATVHHLVSTVTGRLKPKKTAIDALRACFPGGSITGAPKCRAMEIISELENRERGPYCGAIGYIGFDGAMDTNIVIRTLVMTSESIKIQVGGGIVADSIPTSEFEETTTKAGALVAALNHFIPLLNENTGF